MQVFSPVLYRFPRLRTVLRRLYFRLQGFPDTAITQELIQACVNKPNPTILEIGCNDGGYTLWLDRTFEAPIIYCFEPDPRAIERFKRNVGQRPNVRLFEIALSDHNGYVTFYQSAGKRNEKDVEKMPAGWDLSGSIRKPKEHLKVTPWVTFNEGISVETRSLDTWCEEQGVGIIDLIWIDAQGAELDIFRAGTAAIARTRYIYAEYCNREMYEGQPPLTQLLMNLNAFDVVMKYPYDILLRNKRLYSPTID